MSNKIMEKPSNLIKTTTLIPSIHRSSDESVGQMAAIWAQLDQNYGFFWPFQFFITHLIVGKRSSPAHGQRTTNPLKGS